MNHELLNCKAQAQLRKHGWQKLKQKCGNNVVGAASNGLWEYSFIIKWQKRVLATSEIQSGCQGIVNFNFAGATISSATVPWKIIWKPPPLFYAFREQPFLKKTCVAEIFCKSTIWQSIIKIRIIEASKMKWWSSRLCPHSSILCHRAHPKSTKGSNLPNGAHSLDGLKTNLWQNK